MIIHNDRNHEGACLEILVDPPPCPCRPRSPRRFSGPACDGPERLAQQAREDRRALRRGRHDRHPGPGDRAGAVPGLRPAVHRGQPRRRGRQRGCRHRRQVAGRRLHAAHGNGGHARHQSRPVREAAVRPDQGLRADHARGRRAQRHGHADGKGAHPGHQLGRRFHQVRQEPPGQGQHGLERQRHLDPPGRRAVQDDGRRLHGPLPVPWAPARR